jgi:hypothetical protein
MDSTTDAIRIRDIELRFCGGHRRPPLSSDEVIYVHKDASFIAAQNEVLEPVRPKRLIELGILDGGSVVYWHHRLVDQLEIGQHTIGSRGELGSRFERSSRRSRDKQRNPSTLPQLGA